MGDEATGGGGFDPCECIWNHELAMRRLLNALRSSQALCTDSECFEPGTPQAPYSNPSDSLTYFLLFIGFAFLLFYYRPRNQAAEPFGKPTANNSNNTPPAPPID